MTTLVFGLFPHSIICPSSIYGFFKLFLETINQVKWHWDGPMGGNWDCHRKREDIMIYWIGLVNLALHQSINDRYLITYCLLWFATNFNLHAKRMAFPTHETLISVLSYRRVMFQTADARRKTRFYLYTTGSTRG
jgi:hypothetical protein